MKRSWLLLTGAGLSLTVWMVVGCSPAARQNTAGPLAAAGTGAAGNTSSSQRKIMLFGGHDHRPT